SIFIWSRTRSLLTKKAIRRTEGRCSLQGTQGADRVWSYGLSRKAVALPKRRINSPCRTRCFIRQVKVQRNRVPGGLLFRWDSECPVKGNVKGGGTWK